MRTGALPPLESSAFDRRPPDTTGKGKARAQAFDADTEHDATTMKNDPPIGRDGAIRLPLSDAKQPLG